MEKSRLHIPLLFGQDVIHGHRTMFPVPLALAASFDPGAAELVARNGAEEARADGLAWVFSPMVDIARDPRWGRIIESAGEDPYLGSAMARAFVKGYQQDDLSKPDSVAACVKHFAAYGAAIAGRDYNATDMSEITLRQVYLEPYRAAVEAGAATLMSSFNSINGVPATCESVYADTDSAQGVGVRRLCGFRLGRGCGAENHSIGDGPTVARKALEAGVDMDMEGDLYTTVIAEQVRSGKIPESVVDEAVRRVLRVKFALGLFDHPYAQVSPAYEATPERRAEARKVAEETFVLLKNEPVEGVGALLPLRREGEEGGADWTAGRQPAGDAGRVGGDGQSQGCGDAEDGVGGAAGRPVALRRGLRAAERRRRERAEAGDIQRAGCRAMSTCRFRMTTRRLPKRWRRRRRRTW